jgi:WD40 repeat protein
MRKKIFIVLLQGIFVIMWSTILCAQNNLSREARETVLFDLESLREYKFSNLRVSPDLLHFAIPVSTPDKKMAVFLDGEMQGKFDGIALAFVEFSPDSRRLIYPAVINKPDGSQDKYVVVNGKTYGPYADLLRPVFSSNGRHIYYFAREGGKFYFYKDMVRDETRFYEALITKDNILCSPNGERTAFAALVDGKARVVVDNNLGPEFEDTGKIVFSPDSKRTCYSHKRGDKWYIMMDGEEAGPYDEVSSDKWFSPDSQKRAFWARKGNKYFMVVNDSEKPIPGIAGMTVFSSDSKRIAYLVSDEMGKKYHVVVDDDLLGSYKGIVPPQFSPDSTKFAFGVMVNKNKAFVITNGNEGKTYRWVGDLSFSPNSKHLVYSARDKKNWYVVLNGEEIATYKEVGSFTFSEDSSHLAYFAVYKDGGATIVVDGLEGRKYDIIFKKPSKKFEMSQNVVFDTPSSFHYLAIKDNKIILVKEELK